MDRRVTRGFADKKYRGFASPARRHTIPRFQLQRTTYFRSYVRVAFTIRTGFTNGFHNTITNSPPAGATGSTVVSALLLTDDSTSIYNESAKSLRTTRYRVATRRAAHWGARRSGLLIHPMIPPSSGADCRRPIIFSSVIRFAGQSDRAAVCVRSRGTSAIPSCDSKRTAWYAFPGPLL